MEEEFESVPITNMLAELFHQLVQAGIPSSTTHFVLIAVPTKEVFDDLDDTLYDMASEHGIGIPGAFMEVLGFEGFEGG